MKKHVIVGHFGQLDTFEVSLATDEIATRINLVAESKKKKKLSRGIGRALHELKSIGIFPSEVGLDLLVLAALVHVADTRISRTTESQDTWTRELRLVVPVSDPVRWAEAIPLLSRMLDFLTGDRWTFAFRPRHQDFASAVSVRPPGMIENKVDSLSLFSGGLDSLIGAINLLESGRAPLLVGHVSENATSTAQHKCIDGLKAHYQTHPFSWFRCWMQFPGGIVNGIKSEDTTRGRSFLFIALGVFAGTGLDVPFTLRVPENGLIALNVPLDGLRLGALSTRTTHPFYLARWNELLNTVGIHGRVENPYWNKTKGEMVALCANESLLRRLVRHSLSCSAPGKSRYQGHAIKQCGYCVPCLIRRAAIEAAWGRRNDPTEYTVEDLRIQTLNTRQAEGQQVRSFQLAIDRLRASPGLERILIYKPGPLMDERARLDELAAIYRRGMDEVGALLAGVSAVPS